MAAIRQDAILPVHFVAIHAVKRPVIGRGVVLVILQMGQSFLEARFEHGDRAVPGQGAHRPLVAAADQHQITAQHTANQRAEYDCHDQDAALLRFPDGWFHKHQLFRRAILAD